MDRVKWFLNHDRTILLGVPVKGYEEDGYVKMQAQLNMGKQVSLDTLADYQLYAEYGRTLEHSVGVREVRRCKSDPRLVLEWELWEFSTLTHWGGNKMTPLVCIKSAGEHVELLEAAVKMKYSDERLKNIEETIGLLKKAISGSLIVKCPYCGLVFDYSTVHENTLSAQVHDAAARYLGWLVDDVVHQEILSLDPLVREEVLNIVSIGKMKEKSLDDLLHHVYCPKCYTRVFRHDAVIVEEKEKGIFKSISNKFR